MEKADIVHWTMEKADIVTSIANVAEKFAKETTNLRAQTVRRSAQNQEARPQITFGSRLIRGDC